MNAMDPKPARAADTAPPELAIAMRGVTKIFGDDPDTNSFRLRSPDGYLTGEPSFITTSASLTFVIGQNR